MAAQKGAILASLLLAALATQAFVAVSTRSGPVDKAQAVVAVSARSSPADKAQAFVAVSARSSPMGKASQEVSAKAPSAEGGAVWRPDICGTVTLEHIKPCTRSRCMAECKKVIPGPGDCEKGKCVCAYCG